MIPGLTCSIIAASPKGPVSSTCILWKKHWRREFEQHREHGHTGMDNAGRLVEGIEEEEEEEEQEEEG